MSVKKTVTRKSAAAKSNATKLDAEKPPGAKPAAPAPSAAAADADLHASAYALPAMVARTAAGPAITVEQVMVYIDVPPDQLVATGQMVRTERIDLDTARLYGTAHDFFQAATPPQRAALPALTMQRLRVSIWAAAQGQAKNRAALAAQSQAAAAQDYRATDAKQIKEQARGVRRVIDATLFTLTGGNELRINELRVAYGRSEKPQELASSLVALANLLDRYLVDPDHKIAARRAEMQLDDRLAQQARALAEQVLVRGSAEKAPRAATSNAEVDLWDGINLHLLDQMITLFEAGHLFDPTVPRLLPLSLRSFFGRSRPVKAAPAKPSLEPGRPAA